MIHRASGFPICFSPDFSQLPPDLLVPPGLPVLFIAGALAIIDRRHAQPGAQQGPAVGASEPAFNEEIVASKR